MLKRQGLTDADAERQGPKRKKRTQVTVANDTEGTGDRLASPSVGVSDHVSPRLPQMLKITASKNTTYYHASRKFLRS